ncbi:MAG: hypothetical protein Q9187_001852 [Circinaria calcarea]
MDYRSTISDEERKAQDKVLEGLLSDQLFNEFDPTFWCSAEADNAKIFAKKVFPLLARYLDGEKLDEIVRSHQWLDDIAIPSKISKSAQIFQKDPAHNLTILDLFAKLHFLKTWGSATIFTSDPMACIFYEMFKIINAMRNTPEAKAAWKDGIEQCTKAGEIIAEIYNPIAMDQDLKPKSDNMCQDFPVRWDEFVKENGKNSRRSYYSELADYKETEESWLLYVEIDELLCKRVSKQAMTAFLENSSNTNAYERHSWGLQAVIQSWATIQDSDKFTKDNYLCGKLMETWKQVVRNMVNENYGCGKRWAEFSDRIWSFCLAAGCPKPNRRDPFKSLEALRAFVSGQFAFTADLHKKISELNQQIMLQQRMITALAYRNVLENISATTPGRNSTEKWEAFIQTMFKSVENGSFPSGDAFNDLFDRQSIEKKYDFDYLKQMAEELYSTLSRTIHNFQPSRDFDQYTLVPSQFDPMQIDFMAAMAPLKENRNRTGDPNWEKERKRYPKQIVSTERAEKKPQKQTEKAKEAISGTDGIIFSSSGMEDLLDAEQNMQAEWSSSNQSIKCQSDLECEEHEESSESEKDQASSDTEDASFFRSGKKEER